MYYNGIRYNYQLHRYLVLVTSNMSGVVAHNVSGFYKAKEVAFMRRTEVLKEYRKMRFEKIRGPISLFKA